MTSVARLQRRGPQTGVGVLSLGHPLREDRALERGRIAMSGCSNARTLDTWPHTLSVRGHDGACHHLIVEQAGYAEEIMPDFSLKAAPFDLRTAPPGSLPSC
ncbi:MAG TPA: hypothetical protein VLZ05_16515 [Mycobacterium sp.]|nr:hypothetical protein [Mycobacterium sp.]